MTDDPYTNPIPGKRYFYGDTYSDALGNPVRPTPPPLALEEPTSAVPQQLAPDTHMRRTGDDYAEGLNSLLPLGPAWPRDPLSALMATVRGLAQIWGLVDSRAADLLEQESDPRKTLELLPDWERNWGLPDPCYEEPQSIGERQRALVMRMTIQGAQSREFFIQIAAMLGYVITISEYRVWVVGIDRCGDSRIYGTAPELPALDPWGLPIVDPRGVPVAEGQLSEWPSYGLGPPGNRFYWTVHVDQTKLIWFRVGSGGGQTGIDPHLRIGRADDLECLLNRWKPAHTIIIFDYSGMSTMPDHVWFEVSKHQCGVDPHCRIFIAGVEG